MFVFGGLAFLFATAFQMMDGTKGLDVACCVVGLCVFVVGVVFRARWQDHVAWLVMYGNA